MRWAILACFVAVGQLLTLNGLHAQSTARRGSLAIFADETWSPARTDRSLHERLTAALGEKLKARGLLLVALPSPGPDLASGTDIEQTLVQRARLELQPPDFVLVYRLGISTRSSPNAAIRFVDAAVSFRVLSVRTAQLVRGERLPVVQLATVPTACDGSCLREAAVTQMPVLATEVDQRIGAQLIAFAGVPAFPVAPVASSASPPSSPPPMAGGVRPTPRPSTPVVIASQPPPQPLPSTPPPTPISSTSPPPTLQGMPDYPWPPPQASAWHVIPRDLIARQGQTVPTMRVVSEKLVRALEASGYVQKSFFKAPSGFAVITQMERMNADGRPGDNPRWFNVLGSDLGFSLARYVGRLLHADPGQFRLIVFIATDQPFSNTGAEISSAQAQGLLDRGALVLDSLAGNTVFSENHQLIALIYEFRKRTGKEAEFIKPSTMPGQQHLVRTRLMSAIETALRQP